MQSISYKLIENLKNTLRYLRLKFFMCTLKTHAKYLIYYNINNV